MRSRRLFRRLLALYPASFRDRFGTEMEWVFVHELAEARSRGRLAEALFLLATLADMTLNAADERVHGEDVAAQPVSRNPMTLPPPVQPWRSGPFVRLLSLAPLLPVFLIVSAPKSFGDGIGVKPPEFLGLPLGAVLVAGCVGWGLLGTLIVSFTHSRVLAVVGIVLFTIPSTIGLLLGPAIVLMLTSLET